MKRKEYAPELTKEYLQKLGVEDVDPSGRFIIKNGKPIPVRLSGKKRRRYLQVDLYDPDLRQATPIEERNSSTGKITLRVHIINYAWQHGIKPAGLEVHHIDRNSTNNAIDNLVALTHEEHLQVHNEAATRQLKCRLDKPLSFYEDKLNKYINELEEAKESLDEKACHTLRSNISNTRARIRYWLAHQEEAEKLIREPKEKKGYVKNEKYHEVAKMKKYVSEKSKDMIWSQGKLIRKFVRVYDDRDYDTLKELYNALGGN